MSGKDYLARRPEDGGFGAKSNLLLLGISYPSVENQMKEHGFQADVLANKEPSVDQAVECVRRGIMTEMDARDYARCVATEQATGSDVYTVSMEMGGRYRDDRHMHGNFNSRNFVKSLRKKFGNDIAFSQIVLDYYWMPTGWLVTRWAKTLFQQTLPDLVRYNLLQFPIGSRRQRRDGAESSSNKENAGGEDQQLDVGVVYLPFCAHCCKEVVGAIDILEKYYAIDFITKDQLPKHALWKGTMQIDGHIMQTRLGKRLDQEEVYCTFKPKDIYESMEDSHISKPAVMKVLLRIPNYDDVRMIRLRPLRQFEPPSVMKERLLEPEVGGFKGLLKSSPKNWTKTGRVKVTKPPPPLKVSKTKNGVAPKKRGPKKKQPFQIRKPRNGQLGKNKKDRVSEEGVPLFGPPGSKVIEVEEIPVDAWKQRRRELRRLRKGFFGVNKKDEDVPRVTMFYPQPTKNLETYFCTRSELRSDDVVAEEKPRNKIREMKAKELQLAGTKRKRSEFEGDWSQNKSGDAKYLRTNPRVSPTRLAEAQAKIDITTNLELVNDTRPTFMEGACALFEMAQVQQDKSKKPELFSRDNLGRSEIVCYALPRSAVMERFFKFMENSVGVAYWSPYLAKHQELEDLRPRLTSRDLDMLMQTKLGFLQEEKKGVAEEWRVFLTTRGLQFEDGPVAFDLAHLVNNDDGTGRALVDFQESDPVMDEPGNRRTEIVGNKAAGIAPRILAASKDDSSIDEMPSFAISPSIEEGTVVSSVFQEHDPIPTNPVDYAIVRENDSVPTQRLEDGMENVQEEIVTEPLGNAVVQEPGNTHAAGYERDNISMQPDEEYIEQDESVSCDESCGSVVEPVDADNKSDDISVESNVPEEEQIDAKTEEDQQAEKKRLFSRLNVAIQNRWNMLDHIVRWLCNDRSDAFDPTNGDFKKVDSQITSNCQSIAHRAKLIELRIHAPSAKVEIEDEEPAFSKLAGLAGTAVGVLKTQKLEDNDFVNDLVDFQELEKPRANIVKDILRWLRDGNTFEYTNRKEEEFAHVYSIVQLNKSYDTQSVGEIALEIEQKLYEFRQSMGSNWFDRRVVEKEMHDHDVTIKLFAKRFGPERAKVLEDAFNWLSEPKNENDPLGEFRLASEVVPDSSNMLLLDCAKEIEHVIHHRRTTMGADWSATASPVALKQVGHTRTEEIAVQGCASAPRPRYCPEISPDVSSASSFGTAVEEETLPSSEDDDSSCTDAAALPQGFGWVKVRKLDCGKKSATTIHTS